LTSAVLGREGSTALDLPPSAGERGPGRRRPVFYNRAMATDRDIGVALANAIARSDGPGRLRGWEMLAATGVRGLRVLHESPLESSLLLTERDPEAFRVLEANAQRYRALGASARLYDARSAVEGGPFDLVDLDPYGTPAPFLPAALDALAPGGLLAVTATDMRVLAGVEHRACELRYAARPVRGRLGPEGGLRILLAWIDRAAAERGRRIRPIAAYVRDHHVRAYLRLEADDDRSPRPIELLQVDQFSGPRLPGDGPYGPLWVGPLFDPAVVRSLECPTTAEHPAETDRFLARLREEAGVDAPFYYEPNELARALRLERPPPVAELLNRLQDEGWAVARSHARPGALRTPAPRTVVEAAAAQASPRTTGSSRSCALP